MGSHSVSWKYIVLDVLRKCHAWKKVSPHRLIQQVTCKIPHGAKHGHACKNEAVIERYCMWATYGTAFQRK